RGNDVVREAMNAAFLYHAIGAGLDMGIVNAGQLEVYEEIPKDLLERVEDVLLNRRSDAADRLTEFAESVKSSQKKDKGKDLAWRTPCREAEKAKAAAASPDGSAGSSAPAQHQTRGRVLMATVKGDVHDIGKNIVGVVLACNDYEIIDLGVMVPCEKILSEAR